VVGVAVGVGVGVVVGVSVSVGTAVELGVGVAVGVEVAVVDAGSFTTPFDWRVTEVCVDALPTFT
jgi:hypothetical protein